MVLRLILEILEAMISSSSLLVSASSSSSTWRWRALILLVHSVRPTESDLGISYVLRRAAASMRRKNEGGRAVADGGRTSDFPHVPNEATCRRSTIFVLHRHLWFYYGIVVHHTTYIHWFPLAVILLWLTAASRYVKIGSALLSSPR